MNHNTARCSSCNTICQLPHLRARASAAKCEACARREAERARELRSDEYATSPPQLQRRARSLGDLLIGVDPGFGDSTVAVVLDKRTGQLVDKWEQRECFQRISHASYRRSDDMVEVSFMGELGIAKNTLSVPGAFVRTCFGAGYDVSKLVGGEVRYEGVTGKVTGLSAGPDKWEQRAREVRGSLAAIMVGMWPADQPDHLEQIARELTEEKRGDGFKVGDKVKAHAFIGEPGWASCCYISDLCENDEAVVEIRDLNGYPVQFLPVKLRDCDHID